MRTGPDFHPLPNKSVRVRTAAGADPQRALTDLDLRLKARIQQPMACSGKSSFGGSTSRVQVNTHRPQAQHRARTLEYRNLDAESTESRLVTRPNQTTIAVGRITFTWDLPPATSKKQTGRGSKQSPAPIRSLSRPRSRSAQLPETASSGSKACAQSCAVRRAPQVPQMSRQHPEQRPDRSGPHDEQNLPPPWACRN